MSSTLRASPAFVRAMSGRAETHPWRVGFAHPLSAFQTFCVLLALDTGGGA